MNGANVSWQILGSNGSALSGDAASKISITPASSTTNGNGQAAATISVKKDAPVGAYKVKATAGSGLTKEITLTVSALTISTAKTGIFTVADSATYGNKLKDVITGINLPTKNDLTFGEGGTLPDGEPAYQLTVTDDTGMSVVYPFDVSGSTITDLAVLPVGSYTAQLLYKLVDGTAIPVTGAAAALTVSPKELDENAFRAVSGATFTKEYDGTADSAATVEFMKAVKDAESKKLIVAASGVEVKVKVKIEPKLYDKEVGKLSLDITPTYDARSFPDVEPGVWYEKAVKWAVENGITNGTGEGFSPNGAVTRAETVTFLCRAYK